MGTKLPFSLLCKAGHPLEYTRDRPQAIGMEELDEKHAKVEALCRYFTPCLGRELSAFETAQTKLDDEWGDWFGLPIRLYFGNYALVSIAWSHFDKLFVSGDKTLNCSTDGLEIRWLRNSVCPIKPAISGQLKSVKLGRGEMSIGDRNVDIWTRVLLEQDHGWLEIFNGLDENGFYFYRNLPAGEFVTCCKL